MRKVNQIRLNLFPLIIAPPREHYRDLPIDKKINLKANASPFASYWIRNSTSEKNGFLGRIEKRDAEQLNEKWFWHTKNNKNRNFNYNGKSKNFKQNIYEGSSQSWGPNLF